MVDSSNYAPDAGPQASGPLVSGRYLVLERLATGGMGAVWKVVDRTSGADLALKRLIRGGDHASETLAAFQREYQVLKGIAHPRIIRVFDYGIDDEGPYYTMELLPGRDLRAGAPFGWETAASYLRDVATSLALIHARRFVHRDVSPGNVRITLDGHCKLLDFGALVPFGHTPLIVGTAPMVPPEALLGGELDQRSDLYALGALAYWMLTGRHAYPAKKLNELPQRWRSPPLPLLRQRPDVPRELDALIMSLLSAEPQARPSSAAEVISVLTSIAALSPEKRTDERSLLASFLTSPRFIGRGAELSRLNGAIGALFTKRAGCALRVEAMPGMGRTRLLEEAGLRAQLAGAIDVHVDASVHGQGGVLTSLALRLLEAAPVEARETARASYDAVRALGAEVAARLSQPATHISREIAVRAGPANASFEDWVVALSERIPLVVTIDNVEQSDPASLALLASLALGARQAPLLLVMAERSASEPPPLGLSTLQARCETLRLAGFTEEETLVLARSLFGEQAANVERFASWLHVQTDGTPLYILELVRQLIARDLIRLTRGLWVLPQQRPDVALPQRLESALSERVGRLSPAARALCGRLALHRRELSLELCSRLLPDHDQRALREVLDELAHAEVLRRVGDEYGFHNAALREAVAQSMPAYERIENHCLLGAALLQLARPEDHPLRLEAGWHLIQGDKESEGADIIMRVTCDGLAVRRMLANLCRLGQTAAAALEVYLRQRRSAYQRVPLLGALAQAGFYEDPVWGDRYGDQAIDVLQELTGMTTALRWRRFVGRHLALVLALACAFGRFLLTPKRERPYSFQELITHLLGSATTVAGVAASSLDAERAARVAQVIEPFSVLPEWFTPVGVYQFCHGLQQIAREQQAEAWQNFEVLLARFRDPRYYRVLPPDGRKLYITGILFAMGAFAVFRAKSKVVLQIADELDASGLKMYAMVASQLRYLYHANRGELEQAAKQREQVEVHAVQVGSAAQVERWEPAALIPLAMLSGDVVGMSRALQRLQMSSDLACLRPYERLAEGAAMRVAGTTKAQHIAHFLGGVLASREPRSFVGWGLTCGGIAGALLQQGQYERAEALCLEALARIDDDDREYVMLFLELELQLAHAQAALGRAEEALERLARLIARHASSQHPLALGMLYETRARIAHAAGRRDDFLASTREAERWLRPTNMPQLIAKCERLWELSRTLTGPSQRVDALDPASWQVTVAATPVAEPAHSASTTNSWTELSSDAAGV